MNLELKSQTSRCDLHASIANLKANIIFREYLWPELKMYIRLIRKQFELITKLGLVSKHQFPPSFMFKET